jgi:hypothetical protein
MCLSGIKWLLLISCTACSSAKSGIQVSDEQCRRKYIQRNERQLLVFMSYPYCSGCVTQLSELLRNQAPAHRLKPVYLVYEPNRRPKPVSDCLHSQALLALTKQNYPAVRKAYTLLDSNARSGITHGMVLQRNGSMQLSHDSMFHGIQLQAERVKEFLGRKEK